MTAFKSNSTPLASAYAALGMAEKLAGNWAVAENEVKKALAIHEKNNYLEEAAYDWYLIASIRSTAGNHNAALEALRTSIAFDRRAENGFGAASSWQAMGDVYTKAGRGEDGRSAYRRAAEIFRALRRDERVENLAGKY
jgi:tetratricopeptide (TPR) repeat protein